MAAQIPIKNDPVANEAALTKVRNDKLREVKAGHDGTWVAHPGLVDIAMAIFNEHMKGPNQLDKLRLDVNITAKDLLPYNVPGKITEAGIRGNISVGLQYMESWLRGLGCVPINNVRTSRRVAEEKTWLDPLNQSTARPLVRGGECSSWRTPPQPRSRARSCGSGCATAPRPTPVASSPRCAMPKASR